MAAHIIAGTAHPGEEWRRIPGFDAYEVSDRRRVRSFWTTKYGVGGRCIGEGSKVLIPEVINGTEFVRLFDGTGRNKRRTILELFCVAFPEASPLSDPSEEFRPIATFPAYRASRNGVVETCWSPGGKPRRLTNCWRPLHPALNQDGYYQVVLYGDRGRRLTRRVHQIVAELFIGPNPGGLDVLHRDDVKTNNRASNLYYGNDVDNGIDRARNGRSIIGSRHHNSRLSEADVLLIRQRRSEGTTRQKLAETFGVSLATIKSICAGLSWKHVAMVPGCEPKSSPMSETETVPILGRISAKIRHEGVLIPGFDGYRVFPTGRIDSCMESRRRHQDRWVTLNGSRDKDGYIIVTLSDGAGKVVHRKLHQLIAEIFIGPRPPGYVVLHRDNDPANNDVSNLRYGTQTENQDDLNASGRTPKGNQHHWSRLTEAAVVEILALKGTCSQQSVANRFGVTQSAVSMIWSGRRWAHVAD